MLTTDEMIERGLSIGEIVANDYRAADVFKKYKIDFCCGGKKTIAEACSKKNVNPDAVKKDLSSLGSKAEGPSQNFAHWDPAFLADYIVNVHHKYVTESIPVLLEYTNKVARVHGDSHPEAIKIAQLFIEAAEELSSHMIKEERVLFPYVKQLASMQATGSPFGSVRHPVNVMEDEHELVGKIFEEIRQLTQDYMPPAGACATFRVSYLKLKEFEEDLQQHIHLENNILFPKAIELEDKLRGV